MNAPQTTNMHIVYAPDMRPIGGRLLADAPDESTEYMGYLNSDFYVPMSNALVHRLLLKTQFGSELLPRMAPTAALLLLEASETAPRSLEPFKGWVESLLAFWAQPEHGCPAKVLTSLTKVVRMLNDEEMLVLANQLARFHTGEPLEEFQEGNPSNTSRVLHVYAELPEVSLGNPEVHPNDREAPGLYEVTVPATLSDAEAASCALYGFGSEVPIKYLYQFTMTVVDPKTGQELEADDDHEDYALRHQCRNVTLLSRFLTRGIGFAADEEGDDY
jgi:hypothetical protein